MERLLVPAEYEGFQFLFGKIPIGHQIRDKHGSAVVGGVYRHRLRILKEQTEGELIQEFLPFIGAYDNFARRLFGVFPPCFERYILGRHGRGNFHIPADKGVPLSCRGGRCGNRRAVTLRNRSDFSAACGVKGHCVGVRYPFCIQCYVIGDFIACIIPRRAVGLVPATEGIARCGGGVVGTRRESAGGQNLLCVFTVAVLVGHDDAGRIAVNIQTAVEEAPVNMAWIYTGSSADHRLAFEGGNTVIFCKTGDLT